MGDFAREGLGLGVLFAGGADKSNQREVPCGIAVSRLAVAEAGKPSEPPPICRAGVGSVADGKSPGCQAAERLGKYLSMFQPCLEVAGAGFDNGARREAIGNKTGEDGAVKVVKDGETVFSARSKEDVRTLCVLRNLR